MSGGIAYVWAPDRDAFRLKCNLGTVELEDVVADEDKGELFDLICSHRDLTGSTVARHVTDNWPEILSQFVKVMPIDYKRVLLERAQHDEEQEAEVHNEAISG